MTSAISARRVQHGSKASTAPFPWQQLSILGMSPCPAQNADHIHCQRRPIARHYLTALLHHFPLPLQPTFELTSTFPISIMPHLRANRLHVHLSLRLLHGHILQGYLRYPPNCNLCWYGHLRIYFRRVLVRCCLGSDQRQGGKEAGSSCWTGRNSAQHAGIRIRSESASCASRASPGRTAQWVRARRACILWPGLRLT